MHECKAFLATTDGGTATVIVRSKRASVEVGAAWQDPRLIAVVPTQPRIPHKRANVAQPRFT